MPLVPFLLRPKDTPDDLLQVYFEKFSHEPSSPHLEPIFMELVSRSHEPLVRFFAAKVRNAYDCEDLLQISLIKAFDGRRTYSAARGSFADWLFGIAKTTLANHFRALGREAQFRDPQATDLQETPSPAVSAEKAFLDKEQYTLLLSGCAGERDRKLLEALKRRKVEKEHWNCIQRDMGWDLTPESLRVECHRLEKKLRRVQQQSSPRRPVT